jgi:hypothetical protein
MLLYLCRIAQQVNEHLLKLVGTRHQRDLGTLDHGDVDPSLRGNKGQRKLQR